MCVELRQRRQSSILSDLELGQDQCKDFVAINDVLQFNENLDFNHSYVILVLKCKYVLKWNTTRLRVCDFMCLSRGQFFKYQRSLYLLQLAGRTLYKCTHTCLSY
jgi:hypothetical protein